MLAKPIGQRVQPGLDQFVVVIAQGIAGDPAMTSFGGRRIETNEIIESNTDDAPRAWQVNLRIGALIEAIRQIFHLPSLSLIEPLAKIISAVRWLGGRNPDEVETDVPRAIFDLRAKRQRVE